MLLRMYMPEPVWQTLCKESSSSIYLPLICRSVTALPPNYLPGCLLTLPHDGFMHFCF